MDKIHEGIVEEHQGAKDLAKKGIQQGTTDPQFTKVQFTWLENVDHVRSSLMTQSSSIADLIIMNIS